MGLGMTNPMHIALVALVVLLVFGAKRLPEMGHSLGSGLREFKDSISGSDAPRASLTDAPATDTSSIDQVHGQAAAVSSTDADKSSHGYKALPPSASPAHKA